MARSTASVTTSYANISTPTNPFTQVNLAPNTSEGVATYTNAEVVETMAEIYTYAQQQQSYLMPLFMQRDMTALFMRQDRFNKVQFVQKTEEAPYTPLYVPSGTTRAYSLLQYHQGFQITQTVDRVRRYALMPAAQMELSKALGRLYDLGIIWAISQSVLVHASTAASSFAGVASASTTALPNDSRKLLATTATSGGSTTLSWSDLTTGVFDDIVKHFEDLSIDADNLWVIGTPHLRRKLKGLSDFRDNEKTIAMNGMENSRMVEWLGLKFVFMGPETKPAHNLGLSTSDQIDATGGFVSSGGYTLKSADITAAKVQSFIVVDFSGIQWGTAPFATRAMSSLRDDISYTMQFYTEVGFGGVRVDDAKVLVVNYKA